VEEQVTLDCLAIDKRRPPAPTDVVALVDTIPGELDTDTTIPLDRAAVQPATDGNETELAGPVPGELDETRLDQVDGVAVPSAHLHDPPPDGS